MTDKIEILSLVTGTVIPLADLNDGVFSEKMLGDGFAIMPTDHKIVAPIAGQMVSVFPTGHAYVVKNEEGLLLLIHLGIDTVETNGRGFKIKIVKDQKVSAGQEIAEYDYESIANDVTNVACVVVIPQELSEVFVFQNIKFGLVTSGQPMALITKK